MWSREVTQPWSLIGPVLILSAPIPLQTSARSDRVTNLRALTDTTLPKVSTVPAASKKRPVPAPLSASRKFQGMRPARSALPNEAFSMRSSIEYRYRMSHRLARPIQSLAPAIDSALLKFPMPLASPSMRAVALLTPAREAMSDSATRIELSQLGIARVEVQ